MKSYKVRYECGHDDTVLINPVDKVKIVNHALTVPCDRCARGQTQPVGRRGIRTEEPLTIDLTTPAGSEMGVISAMQNGWTEPEIVAGVRFGNDATFVCPGCRRQYPRSLAMSASLATTCPDCYDDFSG